ncbi:MAG: hypothetical protein ACXVBH_05370 [Flavisolibacter sp.]
MSFHLHIPYDGKLLNARFNRVACPIGKFFIEVKSEDFVVASFEMQKDHFNKWKVTHPVPEWIIKLELEFADAITRNQYASVEI